MVEIPGVLSPWAALKLFHSVLNVGSKTFVVSITENIEHNMQSVISALK